MGCPRPANSGTAFLGRHIVEAAAARGHSVTLFNRGTRSDLFPTIEKLRGERNGDLRCRCGFRARTSGPRSSTPPAAKPLRQASRSVPSTIRSIGIECGRLMRNGEEVCRRTAKGLCYALGTTATRAECARMPADGAGCFVASTAYLRGGVFLDRGVTIGPACEVKSTIVLDSSRLAHLCFVGDSVVGSDVNLEVGVVIANHVNERPEHEITVHIRGQSIQTGVVA